ncbi:hypothetical protein HHL17_22920 [Chitinophaga sp. G-6-1-13]|uniref:GLPGLI family protein n=1 Tax=Chitinophaga fulva TaxID=2728842 RepID=A0A848GRC1_9BACT|nr:hypothetical protein [Chitinophaga fulva]NML40071.1 hypothetical protein [Chitinophaga fulva]
MYPKKNAPKFTAVRYSILICLLMATHLLRAQDTSDTLDVCKIVFAATGKPANSKMPPASMTVYYHPDYLYATQTHANRKETSWLIWHHKRMLLQIDGKQGLPLNYGMQLKTNVYLPEETIDTANNIEKTGSDGDWDNENEYNGPGYGKISFAEDTMTITGHLCKKAVINYSYPPQCTTGLIRRITIWYSPDLPQFYLPPFTHLQKIPGAALMICITTADGSKDCYKATDIVHEQKTISFFRPSKDIRILYPPRLK